MMHGFEPGDLDFYGEINQLESGKGIIYEVVSYLETCKFLEDVKQRAPWLSDTLNERLVGQTFFDDFFGELLFKFYRQTQS